MKTVNWSWERKEFFGASMNQRIFKNNSEKDRENFRRTTLGKVWRDKVKENQKIWREKAKENQKVWRDKAKENQKVWRNIVKEN